MSLQQAQQGLTHIYSWGWFLLESQGLLVYYFGLGWLLLACRIGY